MGTLTDVADVGEGVAGLAAVGALLYAGQQLRQTRKLARERVVSSYLERLNTPAFYDQMSESRDKLTVPETHREWRWRSFVGASKREQQAYFLVMNLFEELATLYNDNLLDRGATKRLLGDVSLDYWFEVSWFVDRYRDAFDPLALTEWSKMNAQLESERSLLQLRCPWHVDGIFGVV